MFKGFGRFANEEYLYTKGKIEIPIVFSTPISNDDWMNVKHAVFARLAASPLLVKCEDLGGAVRTHHITFTKEEKQ